MAFFNDWNAAQEWEKGVINEIIDATPGWAAMDKAQKNAAASAWLASKTPEEQAQFRQQLNERNTLRAQQPQTPQQPATVPQAGIRPRLPSTQEEAAKFYGAKGYGGEYMQNKYGQWIPADAEYRQRHTPSGGLRPGVAPRTPAEWGKTQRPTASGGMTYHAPGIRGSSFDEIKAATAAKASRDGMIAAADAYREKATTTPYDYWRKHHFADMQGRTLFSTRPSQRAEAQV
ncbi:MAG: hypothetical protein IJP66_01970 [Kiritimatiellae bacterium]|nr:hypothetical protein [Kiritimatiellia bacterium]MBR0056071.1 hypothetical protein [Kiritimatiellia bacterium]